jgi:protoheme ferro-lyase
MKLQLKNQTYFKKQREAILNDTHRKQLFQKLFELYANSLPMVFKKENGDVICSYSDEVEETAEKIRELIRLRDNQIFNSMAN